MSDLSSQHRADRLAASISKTGSIACVGLDPRPQLIPRPLVAEAIALHGDSALAVAAAFTRFNRGLLDAIAGACAAVKPQAACYEAYGWPGMQALSDTVAYARQLGIPVIMDGKRNDIGSTAEHYAQAYLSGAPGLSGTRLSAMPCDWLTINGYLGSDGVLPFLARPSGAQGVFVLVKTSNPGSGELQDLALDTSRPSNAKTATAQPTTVMEAMAQLVERWGRDGVGRCGLSDVGAVVGATYPDQARHLRALMPNTLFLVPGYGAQGGSAADALAGRRSSGDGILVNSSRAISAAWQQAGGSDWAGAARAALDAMNLDLNRLR